MPNHLLLAAIITLAISCAGRKDNSKSPLTEPQAAPDTAAILDQKHIEYMVIDVPGN